MPQSYHKMHRYAELIQIKGVILVDVRQVPKRKRTGVFLRATLDLSTSNVIV